MLEVGGVSEIHWPGSWRSLDDESGQRGNRILKRLIGRGSRASGRDEGSRAEKMARPLLDLSQMAPIKTRSSADGDLQCVHPQPLYGVVLIRRPRIFGAA